MEVTMLTDHHYSLDPRAADIQIQQDPSPDYPRYPCYHCYPFISDIVEIQTFIPDVKIEPQSPHFISELSEHVKIEPIEENRDDNFNRLVFESAEETQDDNFIEPTDENDSFISEHVKIESTEENREPIDRSQQLEFTDDGFISEDVKIELAQEKQDNFISEDVEFEPTDEGFNSEDGSQEIDEPKNKTILKCQHCRLKTDDPAHLNAHLMSHFRYKCHKCNIVFKSRWNLTAHLRFLCRHRSPKASGLKDKYRSSTPLQCRECTYTTDYELYMTVHEGMHRKQDSFKCVYCEENFTCTDFMKHIKKHFHYMRTLPT